MDHGLSLQRDMQSKMIVMMIKTLDLAHVICKIRVQCLSRIRMSIGIEDLRFNCSQELMLTGKLDLSFHPTPLPKMPRVPQMDTAIAPNVSVPYAHHAPRASRINQHTIQM